MLSYSRLFLVLALPALACAPQDFSEDPMSPEGGVEDPTPESPGDRDDSPEPEAIALRSTYSMQLTSNVITRDVNTQEESTLRTTAGGIVSVTQDGETVQFTVKMCYAIPPEIEGEQPVIPDAVVANVEPFVLSGSIRGSSLQLQPAALVLGANLRQPLTDPLPTSGGDSRVVDMDSDGEPGITIDYPSAIGNIEIYAAAKFTFSVSAEVADPAAFQGESEAELVTQVFGDSSFLIDVRGLAEEASENSEIVSEQNAIAMDAIADGAGCDSL